MNILQKAKQFLSNLNPFAKKEKPSSVSPEETKIVLDGIDDFVWVDADEIDSQIADERKKHTDALSQFSFTEKLAHSDTGAYGAPQRENNTAVSVKDPDSDQMIDYKIVPIKTKSTGLIAEIFVPINPEQSNKICINWTGTCSLGTILADLEKTPGEKSYRNEELSILNQINKTIGDFSDKSNGKIDLVVTGHSLGGALAQQCFHSLQRAIGTNIFKQQLESDDVEKASSWIEAEQKYRAALGSKRANMLKEIPESSRSNLTTDNIDTITIGTWNSAGVLKAVEENSNTLASYLSNAGVKLKGLFGMVGGDAVQTTGQGTVLSDTSAEDAEVQLLKADKGHEGYFKKLFCSIAGAVVGASTMILFPPLAILGGISLAMLPMAKATTLAHTSKHFIPGEELLKCELFNNASPMNRKIIHDKLANKSEFLQMLVPRAIQRGLYKALNLFVDNEVAIEETIVPTISTAPSIRAR
tara:strand:+ start:21581 stop:22993 length:1413 start_codon:yes stop_codon:yes gene_type:complete